MKSPNKYVVYSLYILTNFRYPREKRYRDWWDIHIKQLSRLLRGGNPLFLKLEIVPYDAPKGMRNRCKMLLIVNLYLQTKEAFDFYQETYAKKMIAGAPKEFSKKKINRTLTIYNGVSSVPLRLPGYDEVVEQDCFDILSVFWKFIIYKRVGFRLPFSVCIKF